jgi:hypothetical protein
VYVSPKSVKSICCNLADYLLVGGQGIASGFRDAVSLAWRLAVASRLKLPKKENLSAIFTPWYMERKQQLERSLATTIENGNLVTASNPIKIFFRDLYLWLVQLVPRWRHQLHLGNRRGGMIRYEHSPGMPFLPNLGGGVCFPQVYCRSIEPHADEIFLTDDVIWTTKNPSLFRLVVLLENLGDLDTSLGALHAIEDLSGGELRPTDAVVLLEDLSPDVTDDAINQPAGPKVYRIASGDDFACSELCNDRPKPIGYNPFRLGEEVKKKRFIFLRPDRFVFAACNLKEEVDKAAVRVRDFLNGGRDIQ